METGIQSMPQAYPTVEGRPLPMERAAGKTRPPQNISQREKWLSTLGGSALALAGLGRGKLSGLIMTAVGGALAYRGWTGHCYAYEALGIDTAGHNPATALAAKQGVKVERSFTINRSADELFSFWRDVENLPRVMRHLRQVESLSDDRSRWVAEGPFGTSVEWEAELINAREPDLIAWRSLPGSDVETAGSVRFRELGHGRGTEIAVSLKYNPPAGKLGANVASLLGQGLEQQLDDDLRRFKSLMEAGEIPTTQGQPSGL